MTTTPSDDQQQQAPFEQLSQTMANTQLSSSLSSIPIPRSLPTTLSRSYKLLGTPTDAYVQIFGDRIVLGVSQRNQRIGTWCLCQATQSAVDPKALEFDIQTVLGDRHDSMIGVYGRQITERILRQRLIGGGSTAMVIFLGLSLQQPKDPEVFRIVLDVLLQLIKDAILQMQTQHNDFESY